MDQNNLDLFRGLLEQELNETLNQGDATLEDLSENEFYADPADRATAESDRSFALRLRDRDRKKARKIQEALRRLEDGEYGICEECGVNIGLARLKARPVTTLCVECKNRLEEEERRIGG